MPLKLSPLRKLTLFASLFWLGPSFASELPRRCAEVLQFEAADVWNQGATARYEFEVAQRYLDWRQHSAENIILASRILGWVIPAFDGVIFEEEDRRIANLSIKGLRVVDSQGRFAIPPSNVARKMSELLRKNVQTLRHWSELEPWDNWFRKSRHQLNALLEIGPPEELMFRRAQFLNRSIDLFSIPTRRTGIRTRIVVAITDMDGNLENLRSSQIPTRVIWKLLAETPLFLESITVMAKNNVWNFDPQIFSL